MTSYLHNYKQKYVQYSRITEWTVPTININLQNISIKVGQMIEIEVIPVCFF